MSFSDSDWFQPSQKSLFGIVRHFEPAPNWATTVPRYFFPPSSDGVAILSDVTLVPTVKYPYPEGNPPTVLVANMGPMTFNGVVTKAGFMNKTVTVTVSRFINHALTGKRIVRSKKYLVHDEKNELRRDDVVIIRNCPPKSARKRFTLHQLVKSPETEREIARAKRLQQQATEQQQTSSPILDAVRQAQQQPSPSS